MTDTDTITANEIAIIGKETDDDGELVFSYRKHKRKMIDRNEMDRFNWLTLAHEEQLADLLDQYGLLLVYWHDDEDTATVYLIPRGADIDDLNTELRYLFRRVEMRFPAA
jgi:hypothetical protein